MPEPFLGSNAELFEIFCEQQHDEVQSFDCKFDDFDGGRNTDASVSSVFIQVPIRNW